MNSLKTYFYSLSGDDVYLPFWHYDAPKGRHKYGNLPVILSIMVTVRNGLDGVTFMITTFKDIYRAICYR